MKALPIILAAFVLSFFMISCQKDTIEPQFPVSGVETLKGNPVDNGGYNNESMPGQMKQVRYAVNVHLSIDKTLRNTYQVELLDAAENLVAPRQIFVPGTSLYNFYEQTRQTSGIRIARLVPVIYPDEHFVAEPDLFTPPAVLVITFVDGQTYSFDLYPQCKPSKIKE
jgi:hypothetical protein